MSSIRGLIQNTKERKPLLLDNFLTEDLVFFRSEQALKLLFFLDTVINFMAQETQTNCRFI